MMLHCGERGRLQWRQTTADESTTLKGNERRGSQARKIKPAILSKSLFMGSTGESSQVEAESDKLSTALLRDVRGLHNRQSWGQASYVTV